ncbi:MAG: hypothetical protein HOQ03_10525 [Thermoleophilia bacterium]|nr:hypothetical protein [Thermoleophilia bacterium]
MISRLDEFVAFATPHVAGRDVLVVGTRSWVKESGLLTPLSKVAASVEATESRSSGRTFEAVLFYEDLNAYDAIDGLGFAADVLAERGRIVFELFTPDTLDDRTVAWFVGQINQRWPGSTSPRELRQDWALENEGRLDQSSRSVLAALDERFELLAYEEIPALHEGDIVNLDSRDARTRALAEEILEEEERALRRGEITPVGLRYAGRRR